MRSNCLLFAIWRTILRGGVLILQRSHAGPYLHAMWIEKLPKGLEVEHFTPVKKLKGVRIIPLFHGRVTRGISDSHANPPKEKWHFSPIFLIFWIINFLGWASFLALLAFQIYSYFER